MKRLTLGLALVLSACGSQEEQKEIAPEEKSEEQAEHIKDYKGMAIIRPQNGSDVVGAVTFSHRNGETLVVADIGGLNKESVHGMYVLDGDQKIEIGNLESNKYGFAHFEMKKANIGSMIGRKVAIETSGMISGAGDVMEERV